MRIAFCWISSSAWPFRRESSTHAKRASPGDIGTSAQAAAIDSVSCTTTFGGKPVGTIFFTRRLASFIMMASAWLMLALSVRSAGAQPKGLDETFARLRQTEKNLGPRAIVSGGARNLFALADNWDRVKAASVTLAAAQIEAQSLLLLTPEAVSGALDLSLTRLAGFTQNETSTAWCGDEVVIGFNDTGSILPSLFSAEGQLTGLGYSVSTDKGATFTDKGFPTLSSDTTSVLGFDQVFTCTNSSNFYFSSLFNDATHTAVSVSTSTDGGQTFGAPVAAVSASNGGMLGGGAGHFFDGDWMTVNPANPLQLFITYTDDDFTGTVCGAGFLGTSIELVSSNDGGLSWSAPITVAGEFCNNPSSSAPGVVEFSDVAVNPAGTTVYVTWESFGIPDFLAREVDIAKAAITSTPIRNPLSLRFGTPTKVSSINFAGVFDALRFGFNGGPTFFQGLQGRILTFEHPILAIGKGPKNNGVLYVTWNDGDHGVFDLLGNLLSVPVQTYHFTDILLSSSADGGLTWSKPVRVNNNIEDGSPANPFTDQFHPALATDKAGRIGVCFYDRRNDINNFLIGRTCAVSKNGKTWTNIQIQAKGSPPIPNQDDFGIHNWLGDYDTLANDALNRSAGFIGGYVDDSQGFQTIQANAF
jgi:hypothetical protein